ncbi:hypothetical protein ACFQV2_07785 [Actinokineospora soli]|uniref:ATP-grasp domain-containing protein n=1 Tax=Actinokineospora soli TaxID=1048753 RepID=A0ABW2TIE6_9PSEU
MRGQAAGVGVHRRRVHLPRPEDLRRAFPAILGARDIFDNANTDVLVQSFLEGTEYIVDTVSVDGAAYVCGVWRYEKRLLENGKPIYNRDILVAETDPVVPMLAAYTRAVLAALGVRNGPAHSEVIVGPRGPAIVEVGARLNGNMHPEFHQRCLGHDQAELTALAYVKPKKFLSRFADGCYQRRKHATVYNAPTSHDGTVVRVNEMIVDAIRDCPSVVDLTVKRKAGDRIVPTRDLLTSPLRVFMTADEGTLEADYRFIESVRESVFEVES